MMFCDGDSVSVRSEYYDSTYCIHCGRGNKCMTFRGTPCIRGQYRDVIVGNRDRTDDEIRDKRECMHILSRFIFYEFIALIVIGYVSLIVFDI